MITKISLEKCFETQHPEIENHIRKTYGDRYYDLFLDSLMDSDINIPDPEPWPMLTKERYEELKEKPEKLEAYIKKRYIHYCIESGVENWLENEHDKGFESIYDFLWNITDESPSNPWPRNIDPAQREEMYQWLQEVTRLIWDNMNIVMTVSKRLQEDIK